jgi:hypothetical protein
MLGEQRNSRMPISCTVGFIRSMRATSSISTSGLRLHRLFSQIKLENELQWPYLSGYQMFQILCASPLLTIKDSNKLRRKIWKSLPPFYVFLGSIVYLNYTMWSLSTSLNIWFYIYRCSPLYFKSMMLFSFPILFFPKSFNKFLLSLVEKLKNIKIKINPHY